MPTDRAQDTEAIRAALFYCGYTKTRLAADAALGRLVARLEAAERDRDEWKRLLFVAREWGEKLDRHCTLVYAELDRALGGQAPKAWERIEAALAAAAPRETTLAEPEAQRDEMTCDRCGRRHGVVWFAPSDIWNAVMREGDRGKPDEFSFCCPICFMALAEARGVTTTGWLVTPFNDGPVRYAAQVVLAAALADEQRVRAEKAEAAQKSALFAARSNPKGGRDA